MEVANIAALSDAYDLMGADCEQLWLQKNGKRNYRSEFLDDGYFVQEIPPDLIEPLRHFFADDIAAPFSVTDARDDYFRSDLDDDTQAKLNRECIYFGPPNMVAVAAMEQALEVISAVIERQLAHPWKVVNVRAWIARPGGQWGPNGWHTDGFARYVRKIMFYPNPPNLDNGTIELITRKGQSVVVKAAYPACVLIDSAILKHRGLPGTLRERPVIEVTLIPAAATSTRVIFAGQNARFPKALPDTGEARASSQSGASSRRTKRVKRRT